MFVRLAHETDFDGWREAARALRLAGVPPEAASWSASPDALFADPLPPPRPDAAPIRVPKAFVDLAQDVVLNRDPGRFGLLYRLLWRLQDEPRLMEHAADPDVSEARDLAKAVSRASHKMKAFVRFRETTDADGEEAFVAWFEPAHRVLERTAPFFVRRFSTMRWSILTPDGCAHWDLKTLTFTPGVSKDQAPDSDALEEHWRTYYASIFNPARLKTKAMQAEMPKRYWRNLPEAALIPSMIEDAERRTRAMVEAAPTEPPKRALKAIAKAVRDGSYGEAYAPTTVEEVWPAVQACRRCDLWRDATQGVAGRGPASAALMFVGEQPGDQEDLAGAPFVGPAGQVFDRALAEAGVPREETYVTNAVKHFKFEPRGKRRIHAKPNASEITACRWWLDHERRLVKPKVIVALGATAGYAVFGRTVKPTAERGRPQPLPSGVGVLTVHPSYLLRLPDEAEKARQFRLFVDDLKAAWRLVA